MKGLGKKVVALAAVAAMTMTSLVGCTSADASVDHNAIVATVGDSEIKAGVANFYIRYQQSSIENYYSTMLGENMWSMEISEGLTYEDSIKDSVMNSLTQLYVLEDHMADYNVTISEEELAAIEAAAESFDKENEAEDKELVSGDKEIVTEILRLLTISNKMEDAMTADVNTEVSDAEAAQKRLRYVRFETSVVTDDEQVLEMTEEEIADVKKEAESFRAEAVAHGDLEAFADEKDLEDYTFTFDAESTVAPAEVIAVADALGEGEFSEVIETEAGYYVIQLTDLFDEEATESAKASVVTERKSERFNEIYTAWEEATEIKIDEEVLATISLAGVKVTEKADEEETTEE